MICLSDNTPIITAIANDSSYDDIFYLMSRGIDNEVAIDLLLKGFIFSNLEFITSNIVCKVISLFCMCITSFK